MTLLPGRSVPSTGMVEKEQDTHDVVGNPSLVVCLVSLNNAR